MKGTLREHEDFINWCKQLIDIGKYKDIVACYGNHDHYAEKHEEELRYSFKSYKNIRIFVQGSCTVQGMKFHMNSYQPRFFDWAFNIDRDSDEMRKVWDKVPLDTEALITHGPPYGHLDDTGWGGEHVGCKTQLDKLYKLPNLKYVFCGHIHSGHGETGLLNKEQVRIYNASTCNNKYKPVNKPIVIEV